jgi:transposase InsO family protein
VFTKWVELAPLKAATALAISNAFRELILLRYGTPEVAITDNGSQFTANVWRDLLEKWGIEHQLTAPYSPQGNPVERANRVLKTMIAQYVKSDHTTWDVYLNEFRYAINTAVHDSTGFTPAMLNFGRELRIPNAVRGPVEVPGEEEIDEPDYAVMNRERLEKFLKISEKCKENMKKANQQQAKHYNLRRREVQYREGDRVWLRSHHLSSAKDDFAAKLAAKYDGPYVVKGRIGTNIYEVQEARGKTSTRAHVKDLKRWVSTVNGHPPAVQAGCLERLPNRQMAPSTSGQ